MSQSDLSSRLPRWALKLQGYSFSIQHRKGVRNVVPDALSRNFTEDLSTIEIEKTIDLCSPHFLSEPYQQLKAKLTQAEKQLPDIKVVNNCIYRRTEHASEERLGDEMVWKLWLPKELVPVALEKAHDNPLSSHCGINKTLERIRRHY